MSEVGVRLEIDAGSKSGGVCPKADEYYLKDKNGHSFLNDNNCPDARD